jgi:hypothetical protein
MKALGQWMATSRCAFGGVKLIHFGGLKLIHPWVRSSSLLAPSLLLMGSA